MQRRLRIVQAQAQNAAEHDGGKPRGPDCNDRRGAREERDLIFLSAA